MASSDVQRKLTAILCADVHGYSRLMGDDPEGTLATLTTYRQIFSGKIQEYNGRVVNAPGDSLLAEFVSVLDAVSCAVDIQRELAERNQELPDHRRMDFRIGVTLGDVLVKEKALYGDGVNIAARLEALADPGGICISRTVYDQVHTRLELEYDYLGEHKVKNISIPVRVYKVLLEPGQAPTRLRRTTRALKRSRRKIAYGLVAVVVVALGAGFGRWIYLGQQGRSSQTSCLIHAEALALPKEPSIAVLAFDNMSGDPEQEYFSDALTENLITQLASVRGLFVIARNSSFKYKGKSVSPQQVGLELGVRYVMEGSVQRTSDVIRITAQLIDAKNGRHLWAEKYDGNPKGAFEFQDAIVRRIAFALDTQLVEGDLPQSYGSRSPEAFDLVARARRHFLRKRKADTRIAQKLLKQALVLDPNYGLILLGWTHFDDARYGWSASRSESRKLARQLAMRQIARNENSFGAFGLLAFMDVLDGDFEKAIANGNRALAIAPNDANNLQRMAFILGYGGRPAEAIGYVCRAIRLNPFHPVFYWGTLGDAYRLTGLYDQAIAAFQKVIERRPDDVRLGRIKLAATFIQAGREEEGREVARQILQRKPKFSVKRYEKSRLYKDKAETGRMMDALRKAGLPE